MDVTGPTVPPPKTYRTTGTNTNPLLSKYGKVVGGPKKKVPAAKDTLAQVLGKLRVQVPMLSAVAMDVPMRNLLLSKLVQVVYQTAGTLVVPEGTDVKHVPHDQFQQQVAVLGSVQLNQAQLAEKKLQKALAAGKAKRRDAASLLVGHTRPVEEPRSPGETTSELGATDAATMGVKGVRWLDSEVDSRRPPVD